MNTRSLIRPAVAGAGIAAAAVVAFALPAGASVGVQSSSPGVASLKLGGQATIEANGAVVFAPTKVKCAVGSDTYVSVRITEAVGDNIAAGSEQVPVACTGRVQSITLNVSPTEHPFKKGIAWGSAELIVYSANGVVDLTDAHTVQLVK